MTDTFILSALPLPNQLRGILSTIGFLDIIDVILVAIILYQVYIMLKDTRAMTLVKGFIVLLLLTLVCNWLELHVIYWLLQKTVTFLMVALPIVFQPELRRTLEHLGQGRFFFTSTLLNEKEANSLLDEISKAVEVLSANKIGALLVFEREMGLRDICATGVQIDGLVSAEFLLNVFIPNTPLHDGAAVIRGKRLIASACILPLTDNRTLSTELGTRHRAAIGLSEQCDALIVVVSEETGTISIAENGHIKRHLNVEDLREYLAPIFIETKTIDVKDMLKNWRRRK